MATIKYICLDTNAWMRLVEDVDGRYNFSAIDVLLFWIDTNHVKVIVPQNVKDEWSRNNISSIKMMAEKARIAYQIGIDRNNQALSNYDANTFEDMIQKRVDRINRIFESAEIAPSKDALFAIAGVRCTRKLAPNHIKDSYLDTINILSLIEHLTSTKYDHCYFVSHDEDFCEVGDRKTIHSDLSQLFESVNLEFVNNFKALVFDRLGNDLPSYSDHRAEQHRKEREKQLAELQQKPTTFKHENLDVEFLDNQFYIDRITSRPNPTAFEQKILKDLIESHESYMRYFLKRVGDGSLV